MLAFGHGAIHLGKNGVNFVCLQKIVQVHRREGRKMMRYKIQITKEELIAGKKHIPLLGTIKPFWITEDVFRVIIDDTDIDIWKVMQEVVKRGRKNGENKD